jgi:hypothetical protein
MSKQPYQVININPLPPDPAPRGPSCIEAAVALAVAIVAGGVALALLVGAIW